MESYECLQEPWSNQPSVAYSYFPVDSIENEGSEGAVGASSRFTQSCQQPNFRSSEINSFYDGSAKQQPAADPNFLYTAEYASSGAVPYNYLAAYPDIYVGHNGLTFDQNQPPYEPFYGGMGPISFDQFRQPYTPFDPAAFGEITHETMEKIPWYKEHYFPTHVYPPMTFGNFTNSPYCALSPYTQFPSLPTRLDQSMDDPPSVLNSGSTVSAGPDNENAAPPNFESGASSSVPDVVATANQKVLIASAASAMTNTATPNFDDKIRFRNRDYFSVPIRFNLVTEPSGCETENGLANNGLVNIDGNSVAGKPMIDGDNSNNKTNLCYSLTTSRKRPRSSKSRNGGKRNASSRNPILTQFTVKFLKEFFENNDNRLTTVPLESETFSNAFSAYVANKSSKNFNASAVVDNNNRAKNTETDTATAIKPVRAPYRKSSRKNTGTVKNVSASADNAGLYSLQPSALNPVVLLDTNLEMSVTENNNDNLTLAEIKADCQRLKVKRKSFRNRSYEFESLQIGSFYVSKNVGRNKLRLYFGQKQLVYDFEYDYVLPGEDLPPVTLLVVIIVPLSTLSGLEFHSRKIIFRLNQPPRIVSGFNRQTLPELLKTVNFGSTTIDVTDGQLMSPYHLVTLPRAQGSLVQKHLLSFNPAFINCRINYAENSLLAAFVGETAENENKINP